MSPVVGVFAVVAFFDNAHVVINIVGVLQSLARAHEFGLGVRIPSFKLGDGRFRDHHAGRIRSERGLRQTVYGKRPTLAD
jgi:hypothetical protein